METIPYGGEENQIITRDEEGNLCWRDNGQFNPHNLTFQYKDEGDGGSSFALHYLVEYKSEYIADILIPYLSDFYIDSGASGNAENHGLVSNRHIKTMIDNEIDRIVGEAPGTFDTLEKIASYLEEHEDVKDGIIDMLDDKANVSDVYTKVEVDDKIDSIEKIPEGGDGEILTRDGGELKWTPKRSDWFGYMDEYDELEEYDKNTIYYIYEE